MEYVPGLPITTYCDNQRLTIKERLALFTQVCEGVQHAHQATIHRDLKPSNVLVGEFDQKPVPKIIDFGLAKATGPRLRRRCIPKSGESLVQPDYMTLLGQFTQFRRRRQRCPKRQRLVVHAKSKKEQSRTVKSCLLS